MPPTTAAAAVTNGYRRRLVDLRDASALAVAALLEGIDLDARPTSINRQFTEWRDRAAVLATTSAEQAGALSLTYLSAYLMAAGASPLSVPVEPAEPDPSGLAVVRGALLYRLGQGAGRGLAMRTATASARRVTREAVGGAAVETVSRGIAAEPQFTGWRRVTSSSCCARCAVLAGKEFADNAGFDRHPACRCSHEGVVLGRAEAIQRQPPAVVAP